MEEKSQYAIIQAGGQQFTVSPGQRILLNKWEGEKGMPVKFSEVLLVCDGQNAPRVGAPFVEGAVVAGTIVGTRKSKKVFALKRRRKKGYKRKVGHRQQITELLIQEINV